MSPHPACEQCETANESVRLLDGVLLCRACADRVVVKFREQLSARIR